MCLLVVIDRRSAHCLYYQSDVLSFSQPKTVSEKSQLYNGVNKIAPINSSHHLLVLLFLRKILTAFASTQYEYLLVTCIFFGLGLQEGRHPQRAGKLTVQLLRLAVSTTIDIEQYHPFTRRLLLKRGLILYSYNGQLNHSLSSSSVCWNGQWTWYFIV